MTSTLCTLWNAMEVWARRVVFFALLGLLAMAWYLSQAHSRPDRVDYLGPLDEWAEER